MALCDPTYCCARVRNVTYDRGAPRNLILVPGEDFDAGRSTDTFECRPFFTISSTRQRCALHLASVTHASRQPPHRILTTQNRTYPPYSYLRAYSNACPSVEVHPRTHSCLPHARMQLFRRRPGQQRRARGRHDQPQHDPGGQRPPRRHPERRPLQAE